MADTDRKKRIKAAIRAAKKRYDNVCILSGVDKPDGAHILPRDRHEKFVDKIDNIIPLQNNLHKNLDSYDENDLCGRCKFILNNCLPEYRFELKRQILALINIINVIKPDMVESTIYDLIIE